MGQHISYELEGVTYIGYLALPEGEGKAPGVLVCHEGPGISENTFTKADRLAALGFVAFALDYHGGGKMVPLEDMMTKLMALIKSPNETVKRAKAGLNVLLSQSRVDTSVIALAERCVSNSFAPEPTSQPLLVSTRASAHQARLLLVRSPQRFWCVLVPTTQ
jgi:dienelactone hydrolase